REEVALAGAGAHEVVARWSEDWPDHAAEVEMWDRWRWEHQGPGSASVLRGQVPERSMVFHGRALFLPGGERVVSALPELWSVPAWDFETDVYTDRASAWRTARRPGSGQEVEAQVRGTDKAAVEAAFVEACAQAVDRARNPGRYGDTDEW
ncbi:site-specific integrase, partial [Streptomyces sp. NPDC048551]